MDLINLVDRIPCKDFLITMPIAYCATAAVTTINPVVGLISAGSLCLIDRAFDQLTTNKVICFVASYFASALATSLISSFLDMPITFTAVLLLRLQIGIAVFLTSGVLFSIAATALIIVTLALKVLRIHDNLAMAILTPAFKYLADKWNDSQEPGQNIPQVLIN
jgi:hypothetical protein